MAVKPEQIKARLKAKYPKANLSQKRLDALADKLAARPADDADDAAIDVVLEDFNSIVSFEDIAKEDDRVRTLEKNQKPTDPPTPPTPPTDPPTPPSDPNAALLEAINGLKSEIQEIKSGKATETKKATAQSLVDASEVLKGLAPEIKANWVNRIDLNSETPFEEQVKSLETEYTTITQNTVDASRYPGPAPRGGNDAKPNAEEVAGIVDDLI